ncbi:DUF58 domain-containing protein [Tenuibacillus multivorans]|uniref:Uncharacterized conserved protein, DUF58 family, contains vWF domain n=1 Tax=Tenuibacillus multivorans TaxID=237069 RepID=A0A1H0E2T3_9BACI|nr:DUF58 domain-containing protein [Tenuibacillus multivorans]GEL76678.1 hypothetical protein TMU01_09130 [Tenuibacillus multivorans]SDN76645.1 Uncharacterized conserved protein, DUF58 family, contains vWF domain [Tenuibacillus multivorans]
MLKPIGTIIRFILVLLLLGALFSYAMFQGGFVSWFLFFGFVPILLYSFLMIFYPLSLLKVERHVSRKHMQAGQTLNVNLTIKSPIPFPILFIIVEDQLPRSINYSDTRHFKYQYLRKPESLLNRKMNKTILFPRFRRRVVYSYEVPSIPRGKHHLENVKILTGDFLGLVKKEKVYSVPMDLLVEPREINLNINSEIAHFEEGEQSAYSIKANHTNLVSGVRDYAPGDRVSWLDWKTTAKKQKLVTKEFEQEKHKDLAIVLNVINQDEKDWLAFEACVEVANSIARHSIGDHGRVSFVAIGNQRREVKLDQGRRQLDQLTRFLSEIQLVEEEAPFSLKLLKEGTLISNDRNLVVITHHIDQRLFRSLLQINQQDAKISLIFIKGKHEMTSELRSSFDQLDQHGIIVTWLHEDRLTRKSIEVNT